MIKANFKITKTEIDKTNDEQKQFEALIENSGVGSHMVFRTTKEEDEFFIEDL